MSKFRPSGLTRWARIPPTSHPALLPLHSGASRCFAAGATSAPPSPASPPPSHAEALAPPRATGHRTVDAVNAAVSKYPLLSAVIYGYHNAILGGILTATQVALGWAPPPQLAVAFIANRLLARARTPIILLTAGLLTKLRPVYTEAKLSALVSAPLTNLKQVLTTPSAGESEGKATSQQQQPLEAAQLPLLKRWSVRALDGAASAATLGGLVDKYGLSYLFAGRIVSTASLVGIAGALVAGVDTTPAIEWIATQEDAVAAWWSSSGSSGGAALPLDAASGEVSTTGASGASSHAFSKALTAILHATPPPEVTDSSNSSSSVEPAAAGGAGAAAAAAVSPTSAASLLATASDFTARWAASCIAINMGYTWVLRSAVAGTSIRVGTWWDGLMARVEAAEAAERAGKRGSKAA